MQGVIQGASAQASRVPLPRRPHLVPCAHTGQQPCALQQAGQEAGQAHAHLSEQRHCLLGPAVQLKHLGTPQDGLRACSSRRRRHLGAPADADGPLQQPRLWALAQAPI